MNTEELALRNHALVLNTLTTALLTPPKVSHMEIAAKRRYAERLSEMIEELIAERDAVRAELQNLESR